ncbi:hypothetical protein EDD17DRAFT_1756951 [Pisolithus thermaeus]|nr:hypothetical protein EDD17DRAFT_1756951 [Pisolithus thermaeus]
MPTTVKTIRPFYDSDSDGVTAAPPPSFSSLITDQLELFGSGHRVGTLLADEELSPVASLDAGTSVKLHSRHSTPAPDFRLTVQSLKPVSKSVPKLARQKSPSPYQKKVGFHRTSSTPECEATTSPESSEDGAEDSSESVASEDKIPKPPGEPGRPGRGGYTLETALDWNAGVYAKFKKHMHRLIEEHLDTTKCASAQNPALLKVICEKAMDAFPDLENYSNCWPVTDMIMMRLKYTSSRARRQEIEMAAGKGMGKGKKTRSSVSHVLGGDTLALVDLPNQN